jgi:hypothetical protein
MAAMGSAVHRGALAIGLIALVVAGCAGPAGAPRPSDPRELLVAAVRATAAVPTVRLHVEAAAALGSGGTTTVTIDADVDVANRRLAGRLSAAQGSAPASGFRPDATQQVIDVIVTADAVYTRTNGGPRWSKVAALNLAQARPTNTAIADAIAGLLEDQRMTFDKLDPSSCSLGTCDRVIVHVDGGAAAEALATLLGMPAGAAGTIPSTDIAVSVDGATLVVSELRAVIGSGGGATQVLVTVANPGAAVQISAPDPALVDDMTSGGFGGGAATPVPAPALPSAVPSSREPLPSG